MKNRKRGFTLIELLVVVLIIGILAAVALPQYEKAVLRSRWAAMMPILDALRKAHESYYLANGYYEADIKKLDIEVPCSGGDTVKCPNGFYIDNFGGTGIVTDLGSSYLGLFYCPGTTSWSECGPGHGDSFKYTVYLDHSSHPGRRRCTGKDDKGKAFCKSLCGADSCTVN